MEKLMIRKVILVEGKYDKIKLNSIIDGMIITTDGFGIFKEKEKSALLRRLAAERGILVVTDSDGAGLVIRNYINSILPQSQITHLYIPKIIGKEPRKAFPSKEGTLGVEGMDVSFLRSLFEPFAEGQPAPVYPPVTKWDFYADGLTGVQGSADRRNALAVAIGLPDGLSSNALLEAINLLGGYPLYEGMLKQIT